MVDELEESWSQFFALDSYNLKCTDDVCARVCSDQLELISKTREEIERELLQAITAVPVSKDSCASCQPIEPNNSRAISFRLLRAGGYSSIPNTRDLLRASWDPESLRAFNQFLSADSLSRLRVAVLLWMELCVLEDRISRALGYAEVAVKASALGTENGASEAKAARELVIREMLLHREWNPAERPQWLAFEVEGGLQVRPEQYAIIKNVLENPGTICQLNMGLGKTRVIVPCLLLHLANGSKCTKTNIAEAVEPHLVRLYLLPELLDEAFAFLHSALCASVCNRKLFRIPFSRDTVVGDNTTRAMIKTLRHCQRVGGVLIMCPQDRLSLILKWHELELDGRLYPDLHKTNTRLCSNLESLDAFPFVDIFDESDALLSQRRQLIYSVGCKGGLQAGNQRWEIIQTVLYTCRHNVDVLEAMRQPGVAIFSDNAPPHEFNSLTLLPGKKLEAAWPNIAKLILSAVLSNPPRELEWVKLVRGDALQVLTKTILDSTIVAHKIVQQLAPDRCAQILMLRGLFAHNLLFSTLQRRHNVNFGVPRGAWSRKKRLAVPFLAAATPSLRSEFNHVDCSLLFTTISYYCDGLTHQQLQETFRLLLSTGLNERSAHYSSWFSLSAKGAAKDEMTIEKLHSINEVKKIDLGNALQFETLFSLFARNMLVIDYWLNNVVFPVDTAVLPQRLWATPWDLADGARHQMGFSGTKDAALLLPLSVEQRAASMPSINATDGRMLAKLANDSSYAPLSTEASHKLPLAVVDLALSSGFAALIDTGALMAGMSNERVADLVLQRAAALQVVSHKAVVYFDPQRREWVTKDARWGRILPLHSSPISAADSFVYFDEARTRGADIKLRYDAVAALTLCPKLCKDALMQGAGRMRSLDFGQRVVLVAPAEVDGMVRNAAGLRPEAAVTPIAVIQYIMINTVTWIGSKLTEWASQGGHFLATRGARQNQGIAQTALLDEHTDLSHLYAGDDSEISVADQVTSSVNMMLKHRANLLLEEPPSGDATVETEVACNNAMAQLLISRSISLGADVSCRIRANASELECECEVALETEIESEAEREMKTYIPAEETSWEVPKEFSSFLSASEFVQGVGTGLTVVGLASAIRQLMPNTKVLSWPTEKLFISHNAIYSLSHGKKSMPFGNAAYLQAVDMVLVFPTSGEVIVLSDLEMQKLVRIYWALDLNASENCAVGIEGRHGPILCHLAYLRSLSGASAPIDKAIPLALPRGSIIGSAVSDNTLAALQLFAGDVKFGGPARISALTAMFPDKASLGAVRECAIFRGAVTHFSHSDLDEMIKKLADVYDPPELVG